MRANAEQVVPERSADELRPIEFVTENEFSIIRPWELSGQLPSGNSFSFLVRDPSEQEQQVTVEISKAALDQLSLHVRCRMQSCVSFLITCAERHLADFLGENGRCPPQNKLLVEGLDPEELILATRWTFA